MKRKLSIAYYITCFIIDAPLVVLFVLSVFAFLYSAKHRNYLGSSLVAALIAIAAAVIDVGGFMRLLKLGKESVTTSLSMKVGAALTLFSLMYLPPFLNEIGAVISFLLVGGFVLFLSHYYCRYANGLLKSQKPYVPPFQFQYIPPEKSGFEDYKGKELELVAKAEYVKLNNLRDLESNPANDDMLWRYASMPAVYLFKWLFDNHLMADHFHGRYSEIGNPVEFFANEMDYCLLRENIKPEALDFLDVYFLQKPLYVLAHVRYAFDYYDAVRNPEKAYYCVEYSDEAYSKLAEMISARYAHYLKVNSSDKKEDTYSGKVHWDIADKDLTVTTFGKVSDEYISKCGAALNSLSDEQIARTERFINYELDTVYKKVLFDHYEPEKLIVYEPDGDDVAFAVAGTSDLFKEQIVTFSVREGIVFDSCNGYDCEDPFSEASNNRYLLARDDKELFYIEDEDKLNALVQSGDLVKTVIDSGEVYITPYAMKLLNICRSRIEELGTEFAMKDMMVTASTFANKKVPVNLTVRGTTGSAVKFYDEIRIWN